MIMVEILMEILIAIHKQEEQIPMELQKVQLLTIQRQNTNQ